MAVDIQVSSYYNRLAKAETLLVLAWMMDALVTPWLFSQPLAPVWQTALKMALVVGLFGPLFKLVSYVIDRSLSVTRKVADSHLSAGKLGAHVIILTAIFMAFFWTMHHRLPWR